MANTKHPAPAADNGANLTQNQVEEIGQKIVKQKRTRPDRQVQTEPGDNSRYIRHSLEIAGLPKINTTKNEEVENRVIEYFQICEKNDMKPNVAGLALALGIDRVTLWRYREGEIGKNPDVRNTLKNAMQLLDMQMSDYMQNGKINPVAGIFLMKNNFGYADKQEITVTPSAPLGDTKGADQLADQYGDAVVVDDFEDVSDGTK